MGKSIKSSTINRKMKVGSREVYRSLAHLHGYRKRSICVTNKENTYQDCGWCCLSISLLIAMLPTATNTNHESNNILSVSLRKAQLYPYMHVYHSKSILNLIQGSTFYWLSTQGIAFAMWKFNHTVQEF